MNIYQIAERCGVSIATVSRVLNGSEKVSAKTRTKILAVMEEENYTPNIFARGLGLNSIKMIGILCTDIADLYYAKAVSILHQSLREKGFDTLLSCTGTEITQKKKSLEIMLEKRVDAVILVGSAFQELTSNTHISDVAKEIPVAIINGYVKINNVLCVLCAEKEAVENNVRLLYEQGYSKILYLYNTMTYSGMQKQEGYCKGHENCGIPLDEHLIVKTHSKIDLIREQVNDLIDNGLVFDAIMVSEDILAVGAQKALKDHSMRMPIIGFNNSIIAQCATPSITSVDNMLGTLCDTAVSLLTDKLMDKKVPDKVVISAKLVERDSFKTLQHENE